MVIISYNVPRAKENSRNHSIFLCACPLKLTMHQSDLCFVLFARSIMVGLNKMEIYIQKSIKMKGLRRDYCHSCWLKVVKHAYTHRKPCKKHSNVLWHALMRALNNKANSEKYFHFARVARKQMLSSFRHLLCLFRAASGETKQQG